MHMRLGGRGQWEGRSMSSLKLAQGEKNMLWKRIKRKYHLFLYATLCAGERAFLDWDEATRNNIVASYGQMARQTVVELLLFFL